MYEFSQPAASRPDTEFVKTSTAQTGILTRRTTIANQDDSAALLPIWEPVVRGGAPTSDQVLQRATSQLPIPAELTGATTEIVMRPLAADKGHREGNDNKERELRALFTELSLLNALSVRRRLAADNARDALVAAFHRLTIERRTRLIAFLADPRRSRRAI